MDVREGRNSLGFNDHNPLHKQIQPMGMYVDAVIVNGNIDLEVNL